MGGGGGVHRTTDPLPIWPSLQPPFTSLLLSLPPSSWLCPPLHASLYFSLYMSLCLCLSLSLCLALALSLSFSLSLSLSLSFSLSLSLSLQPYMFSPMVLLSYPGLLKHILLNCTVEGRANLFTVSPLGIIVTLVIFQKGGRLFQNFTGVFAPCSLPPPTWFAYNNNITISSRSFFFFLDWFLFAYILFYVCFLISHLHLYMQSQTHYLSNNYHTIFKPFLP